jgi:hypothetical protein
MPFPLLSEIRTDYVYKVWWINHTVPKHRQYLWTVTNIEALILLGALGILGTVAVDRIWHIA